jgi:hypothetical protein
MEDFETYKGHVSSIRKNLYNLFDCKINDVKASQITMWAEIAHCMGLVDKVYRSQKKIEDEKVLLRKMYDICDLVVDIREGKFTEQEFESERKRILSV